MTDAADPEYAAFEGNLALTASVGKVPALTEVSD